MMRWTAFLAADYDDTLGGVALLYRAAALQYADRKFSDSAKNFAAAAKRLQGDPLQGRALIGWAVSLIKDNNADAGVAQLLEISSKTKLLPTDRFEANFLLGVQLLREG